MNCQCEECGGSGRCQECGGSGGSNSLIQYAEIRKGVKNYEELMELKKDAARVMRQAERLIELNPTRAESYRMQVDACLVEINSQANKLSK